MTPLPTSLRFNIPEIESLTNALGAMRTNSSAATTQLVELLKSTDHVTLSNKLCQLLDELSDQLTPVELACAIWTLLQQQLTANQKQTLASTLLLFAEKMLNLQSCPQTQLREACYLFTSSPKVSEVADFLENETLDENIEPTRAFIYETWTMLSCCFSKNNTLESDKIHDVILEHCLQSWIITVHPSLRDGVSTLLLVYAMCKPEKPAGWNLATLAKQPEYIDFLHSAISSCARSPQVLSHYAEFAEVLEDENQVEALNRLLTFILFETPNTIQSQEQCLAAIDHLNNPACSDIENVIGFLRNSTTYTTIFIQKLFKNLLVTSKTTNKKLLASIKTLFELMLQSNWIIPQVSTIEQQTKLYALMHESSTTFIVETTEPLSAIFHHRRSAYYETCLNTAKKQYILALLHSLQHADVDYKRAAIKTIFSLYKAINNPVIQAQLFEKLEQTLTRTAGIIVKLTCDKKIFSLHIDQEDRQEEGPLIINKPKNHKPPINNSLFEVVFN